MLSVVCRSAGSNISSISATVLSRRVSFLINRMKELELLTPVEFVHDWIATKFFESTAVKSDTDIPS